VTLDSTAAAYGLIQVVFADVTSRLSAAVFVLMDRRAAHVDGRPTDIFRLKLWQWRLLPQRIPKERVTPSKLYELKFAQLLDAFRDELKQLGEEVTKGDESNCLRGACTEMKALSKWRNDRVHGQVRQVDDGLALYDGKTRARLPISYEECSGIINRLTKVIVTLETYLPAVVNSADFHKALSEFFSNLAVSGQ
jgi:hypothetical protein